MRPFLFRIGDTHISSFFFLIMVAVLAATFFVYWIAGKRGLKQEYILDMGMISLISGLLGSRFFHIIVEAPDYYWEKPFRILEIWKGGFVSFGALIAIPLSLYFYVLWRRIPLGAYFDVAIMSVPVAQFVLRVACLLTGCCYGKPTTLPWGITFTDPASTAYYFFPNIPLHPTQIYSMIHSILLGIGLQVFYWKKTDRVDGQTFWVLFAGYFLPRALIEFWRGDADRGLWLGGFLSTGQVVGFIGFAIAIGFYLWLDKQAKKTRTT